MKTIELLKNNPKTEKALNEYYTATLIDSADDSNVPKEYIDFLKKQGVDTERLADIIDTASRSLFDFFDENKIYIDIVSQLDGTFMYALLDGNVSTLGSTFRSKTRKEADKKAVYAAIALLESKLISLEKDNKDS